MRIKHTAKLAVAASVWAAGGANRLIKKYGHGRVAILCYHDPKPEVFEQHLEYLSDHFEVGSIDEILDGIWPSHNERSKIVITLDDGHKGNYDLLPVIRKYKIEPAIYLCTGIANTLRQFWWRAVDRPEIRRHLMQLPDATRQQRLKMEHDFDQQDTYLRNRVALNLEEMNAMSKYVVFGAHSRFHPILTNCDDDTCTAEILQSKIEVEGFTKKQCRHFAFPNGAYSAREIETVRGAGFKSARTADWGWMANGHDPYRLLAIHIPDDAPLKLLLSQLLGIGELFKLIRRLIVRDDGRLSTIYGDS